MKKMVVSMLFSSMLFGSLTFGTFSEANELNNNIEPISGVVNENDEFYYVIEDTSGIQSRTWAKTQSYTIKKGKRTFLGNYTVSRKTTIEISTVAGPVTIKLGHAYSESGKFKKYKQEAKITVTYKRYRKVDNKYVDTKTVTANTSYTDYVPA